MGIILVFKDISGEQLASFNKPNTPEEERLFKDALKFKVHNTIKFNFGTRYLGYRIVRIDRRIGSPKAFGQKESIMELEFTLELIQDSGESA
jgi:hypothetical protein